MYTLEEYLFVRNTRYVIWGVVALVFALLIFHAGVAVGSRRALGAYPSGPDYRGFFGMTLPHGYIGGGHGAVGEIQSYNPPVLLIETRGEDTESVTVATTTQVEPAGATSTELVPGARVIIIGTPTQSGLTAKLIRVLPQ